MADAQPVSASSEPCSSGRAERSPSAGSDASRSMPASPKAAWRSASASEPWTAAGSAGSAGSAPEPRPASKAKRRSEGSAKAPAAGQGAASGRGEEPGAAVPSKAALKSAGSTPSPTARPASARAAMASAGSSSAPAAASPSPSGRRCQSASGASAGMGASSSHCGTSSAVPAPAGSDSAGTYSKGTKSPSCSGAGSDAAGGGGGGAAAKPAACAGSLRLPPASGVFSGLKTGSSPRRRLYSFTCISPMRRSLVFRWEESMSAWWSVKASMDAGAFTAPNSGWPWWLKRRWQKWAATPSGRPLASRRGLSICTPSTMWPTRLPASVYSVAKPALRISSSLPTSWKRAPARSVWRSMAG